MIIKREYYEVRLLDQPHNPRASSYTVWSQELESVDDAVKLIADVFMVDEYELGSEALNDKLDSLVMANVVVEYKPLTPEQKKRIVDVMRSNQE